MSPGARGRVAVLALQRLGDVVTGARVTGWLARQPQIRAVELVHFDGTSMAAELLPGVARRHTLPYGALRRLARVQPLAPFVVLREHVASIRGSSGFDTVVNLSSTRFSCLLAGSLAHAETTMLGPWIDDYRRYCTSDPATQYLNSWGVDRELNVFAHQDLYALAAGVPAGFRGSEGLCTGAHAPAEACRRIEPGDRAPLAVHIRSSKPDKDWQACSYFSGWPGLVGELGRRTGRVIFLLGSPSEQTDLAALAQSTRVRCEVFCGPLAETTALLRCCAGLVSVDTVAIHLAAAVGCRSVVLRFGPAGGMAFVPGPGALLVDPRDPVLEVRDVVALAEQHLFGRPLPRLVAGDIARRVRVREGGWDALGFITATTPPWLDAPASDHHEDALEEQWRRAFWTSWQYEEAPDPGLVDLLLRGSGRWEEERRRRLMSSSARLGSWLWLHQQHHQPGKEQVA